MNRRRSLLLLALATAALAAFAVVVSSSGARPAPREPSPAAQVCPDRGVRLVSERHGASRLLVPGRPRSVLLCRYFGMDNGPGGTGDLKLYDTLARSRLISSRRTARRLARRFDHLGKFPKGPMSCPFDDDSKVIAHFTYRSGPENPVNIQTAGCNPADNGHITRAAWRLEPRLLRLTRIRSHGVG